VAVRLGNAPHLNKITSQTFVLDIQTLVPDLTDLGQKLTVFQIDLVQLGLLVIIFPTEGAEMVDKKKSLIMFYTYISKE